MLDQTDDSTPGCKSVLHCFCIVIKQSLLSLFDKTNAFMSCFLLLGTCASCVALTKVGQNRAARGSASGLISEGNVARQRRRAQTWWLPWLLRRAAGELELDLHRVLDHERRTPTPTLLTYSPLEQRCSPRHHHMSLVSANIHMSLF